MMNQQGAELWQDVVSGNIKLIMFFGWDVAMVNHDTLVHHDSLLNILVMLLKGWRHELTLIQGQAYDDSITFCVWINYNTSRVN